MPRLKPENWKVLECIFLKLGFIMERKRGSHRTYVKNGVARPVIIPQYSDVDIEIIKSNMRTANLSRELYFQLLDECKKTA
ncbi:type II toxin-antitoxin system HicA family toxin [bacterium]|nr:type II toxin-antitoxin system HicA family toxin [bacterium]